MRPVLTTACIAFLTLAGTGCTTTGALQTYTSGQIGCPADQIRITDEKMHLGSKTWTAQCMGKRFYCTGAGSGTGVQVACAAELR